MDYGINAPKTPGVSATQAIDKVLLANGAFKINERPEIRMSAATEESLETEEMKEGEEVLSSYKVTKIHTLSSWRGEASLQWSSSPSSSCSAGAPDKSGRREEGRNIIQFEEFAIGSDSLAIRKESTVGFDTQQSQKDCLSAGNETQSSQRIREIETERKEIQNRVNIESAELKKVVANLNATLQQQEKENATLRQSIKSLDINVCEDENDEPKGEVAALTEEVKYLKKEINSMKQMYLTKIKEQSSLVKTLTTKLAEKDQIISSITQIQLQSTNSHITLLGQTQQFASHQNLSQEDSRNCLVSQQSLIQQQKETSSILKQSSQQIDVNNLQKSQQQRNSSQPTQQKSSSLCSRVYQQLKNNHSKGHMLPSSVNPIKKQITTDMPKTNTENDLLNKIDVTSTRPDSVMNTNKTEVAKEDKLSLLENDNPQTQSTLFESISHRKSQSLSTPHQSPNPSFSSQKGQQNLFKKAQQLHKHFTLMAHSSNTELESEQQLNTFNQLSQHIPQTSSTRSINNMKETSNLFTNQLQASQQIINIPVNQSPQNTSSKIHQLSPQGSNNPHPNVEFFRKESPRIFSNLLTNASLKAPRRSTSIHNQQGVNFYNINQRKSIELALDLASPSNAFSNGQTQIIANIQSQANQNGSQQHSINILPHYSYSSLPPTSYCRKTPRGSDREGIVLVNNKINSSSNNNSISNNTNITCNQNNVNNNYNSNNSNNSSSNRSGTLHNGLFKRQRPQNHNLNQQQQQNLQIKCSPRSINNQGQNSFRKRQNVQLSQNNSPMHLRLCSERIDSSRQNSQRTLQRSLQTEDYNQKVLQNSGSGSCTSRTSNLFPNNTSFKQLQSPVSHDTNNSTSFLHHFFQPSHLQKHQQQQIQNQVGQQEKGCQDQQQQNQQSKISMNQSNKFSFISSPAKYNSNDPKLLFLRPQQIIHNKQSQETITINQVTQSSPLSSPQSQQQQQQQQQQNIPSHIPINKSLQFRNKISDPHRYRNHTINNQILNPQSNINGKMISDQILSLSSFQQIHLPRKSSSVSISSQLGGTSCELPSGYHHISNKMQTEFLNKAVQLRSSEIKTPSQNSQLQQIIPVKKVSTKPKDQSKEKSSSQEQQADKFQRCEPPFNQIQLLSQQKQKEEEEEEQLNYQSQMSSHIQSQSYEQNQKFQQIIQQKSLHSHQQQQKEKQDEVSYQSGDYKNETRLEDLIILSSQLKDVLALNKNKGKNSINKSKDNNNNSSFHEKELNNYNVNSKIVSAIKNKQSMQSEQSSKQQSSFQTQTTANQQNQNKMNAHHQSLTHKNSNNMSETNQLSFNNGSAVKLNISNSSALNNINSNSSTLNNIKPEIYSTASSLKSSCTTTNQNRRSASEKPIQLLNLDMPFELINKQDAQLVSVTNSLNPQQSKQKVRPPKKNNFMLLENNKVISNKPQHEIRQSSLSSVLQKATNLLSGSAPAKKMQLPVQKQS